MAPLYSKLRAFPYRQALSPKEATSLRWRTVAIDRAKPRIATPKPKLTERAVYTDEAGKSQIIDAAIIGPLICARGKTIKRSRAARTGRRSVKTFDDAIYIYGMEMMDALAVLMSECDDVRRNTVTFYVDNNALDAIVKNSATPAPIHALTALILQRIRDLGIAHWFERVPSKCNIADLPTRYVKIPRRVT